MQDQGWGADGSEVVQNLCAEFGVAAGFVDQGVGLPDDAGKEFREVPNVAAAVAEPVGGPSRALEVAVHGAESVERLATVGVVLPDGGPEDQARHQLWCTPSEDEGDQGGIHRAEDGQLLGRLFFGHRYGVGCEVVHVVGPGLAVGKSVAAQIHGNQCVIFGEPLEPAPDDRRLPLRLAVDGTDGVEEEDARARSPCSVGNPGSVVADGVLDGGRIHYSPSQFEQVHRPLVALERELPRVVEQVTLPLDQVRHHLRDQDLPAIGLAHDA